MTKEIVARLTDIEFLWMIGYVSLFLLALAVVGQALEKIEARRQRRLDAKRQWAEEEARYRAALDAAARLDASWPPPRVVRGGRS